MTKDTFKGVYLCSVGVVLAHPHRHTQRSEQDSGCGSLLVFTLGLKTGSFRLGWLARELSRSACLFPPMLGSQASEAVFDFSCGYWRWSHAFMVSVLTH